MSELGDDDVRGPVGGGAAALPAAWFDSAPDPHAIVAAATGEVLLANRALAEATGGSGAPADLVGVAVDDLHPEGWRPVGAAVRATWSAGGDVGDTEIELARAGDGPLPVLLRVRPVIEDGKVVAGHYAWRHLPVLRRARALESLIEGAPDAVVVVDEAGAIVMVNQEAERMFGHDRAELLGRPVEVLVPEAQRAVHEARRGDFSHAPSRRTMGAGRAINGRRRDGSTFPVEVGLGLIDTPEGPRVAAAILDISDRQRAEARAADKARELERSNAELEQFAYVASHDLQEPLRMVASYTELLAERYRGQLDERADRYIGYACDGARRMQQLINDLLAYSRVGQRRRAPRRLSSQAVLELALRNLEVALREGGATVTYDPLPDLEADPVQLGQLFQNLVGNAIKFHGASPPAIHVAVERQADHYRFEVRDNGIGFEMEFAERIFLVFQRLHDRASYPGNGIGLAIAKKIVEQAGGTIWAHSVPGQGATFCFTWPVPAAPAEPG